MRIVIAGGGTGGHLTPGLAVADTLKAQFPDVEIIIVGRNGGVAEQLVESSGYRLETIRISGVDVQAPKTIARFATELPKAYRQAARMMREFAPDVVVGTSGYVCVPVMVAASRRNIPTILLEQNAMPGRATRFLGSRVTAIATSYPSTAEQLHAKKIVCTGNPVRPPVIAARAASTHKTCGSLLIMGGSQGARRINRAVAGCIEAVLARYPKLTVCHQCGARDLQWVTSNADDLPKSARGRYHVEAFFDDIAVREAAADLVIMRAGGSSLAECSVVGRPMILVPYPHAHGHQALNVGMYQDAGAAIVVKDEDCTSERLLTEIARIVDDATLWSTMMQESYALGRPAAAAEVVDLIKESLQS